MIDDYNNGLGLRHCYTFESIPQYLGPSSIASPPHIRSPLRPLSYITPACRWA